MQAYTIPNTFNRNSMQKVGGRETIMGSYQSWNKATQKIKIKRLKSNVVYVFCFKLQNKETEYDPSKK